VWVRSAAIRPIPPYAEISPRSLTDAEDWLAHDDDDGAEARMSQAYERFEDSQGPLGDYVGETLARTNDEVALALGYFLSLVIWMAFDNTFAGGLSRVSETELTGVIESLALDEELRIADSTESVDSDDVVGMEQPHVIQFVQEHLDAALEAHAVEADVDAVGVVYRMLLIEVLALSYSVRPPANFAGTTNEMRA
jgi:hypothetical protein